MKLIKSPVQNLKLVPNQDHEKKIKISQLETSLSSVEHYLGLGPTDQSLLAKLLLEKQDILNQLRELRINIVR